MKRVLLVSLEAVAADMAGPGIRYFHFARQLAARHDVTLVVPNDDPPPIANVTVVAGKRPRYGLLRELAPRFDVVVAQQLEVPAMLHLARTKTRTIYDLYVPGATELLAFHASDQASAFRNRFYRAADLVQAVALATGDAFVCASERQRDFWLGRLTSLGRVDIALYERDPSLRDLVDVVPFGLDSTPPARRRSVLKGVVPGIGANDKVLLWAGGVWNWFDPLTVIRAVAQLARERDDVKLYFLGVRHPNPALREMVMTKRAVELARSLDVENRAVFFNFGWVPYGERADYLLEADLGVSAHLDTVETRFAFRTRLLDHVWAGLPTIATRGDVLGDLVHERGLGRAPDYGAVDEWVDAIVALVDDEEERRRARANVAQVRDGFTWERTTEALARLVELDTPKAAPVQTVRMLARYFRAGLTLAATNPRFAREYLQARRA